ncbi:MAG: GAF domain-containing protein [Actinomycetota bacterium]|nr:GAF domain-containing protein [Actinomycetota bacterium]
MTAQELLADLGRLANDLGPAVAPPGSEGLLRALTDTARQLFGAQACSLALLSDDESELVYTTAAGAGADDITGMRMPSGRGIAGWVVMSGQPVAIDDLRNDPRFAQDVAQDTGYVPQALLAVPVASPTRLLGVMTLLDRDAARPGADQDMVLLSVFADQAALALEASRAFSDLGRLLLAALAVAAEEGTDLASALGQATASLDPGDRPLGELAALFAELGRMGEPERRMAVRLVREVLAYTERRSRRPGG